MTSRTVWSDVEHSGLTHYVPHLTTQLELSENYNEFVTKIYSGLYTGR